MTICSTSVDDGSAATKLDKIFIIVQLQFQPSSFIQCYTIERLTFPGNGFLFPQNESLVR